MIDLPPLYSKLLRDAVTPDLLHKDFRHLASKHRLAGHCYVVSEAFFHLMGGKKAKLTATHIKHEGVIHWWLQGSDGKIWDLTAEQFETPVPYHKGRSGGFLTKQPSERARILIDRIRPAIRKKTHGSR